MSFALVLALLATAEPATADIGTIEGVVEGAAEGGLVVVAVASIDAPPRAVPRTFEIEQRDYGFHPDALVVELGDHVAFPNRDKTFHNVFSDTPGNAFDLGLYRRGTSRAVRMEAPGEVDVYCNVHESMRARVLVVPSPHYVVVGRDGRFVIPDVPAGRQKLLVWSSQLEPVTHAVVVPRAGRARVVATLERPREVTLHRRKNGEPYPQSGYGR